MVAVTTLVATSGERLRVKAGMVCLQCEYCVITPERFSGECLTMGRYTNVCLYLFTDRRNKDTNYYQCPPCLPAVSAPMSEEIACCVAWCYPGVRSGS